MVAHPTPSTWRAQVRPAAGLVLLLSLATPLAAHGGSYRGPGSTVPPGGGGAAPVGPVPGSALPGTPGGGALTDPGHWAQWWSFNRDPHLNLKAKVHAGGAGSEGGEWYLGRGQRNEGRYLLRPTDEQLYGRVVPALLEVLREEDDADLQTAALVALAKIGDKPGEHSSSMALASVIRPFLADSNQEVAETAAISLGILASETSVFLLADLLADTESGRRAVEDREVSDRTRAFAAYGLGLVGHASPREDVRRFIVHKLSHALEADESSTVDVQTACVLALGLVPLTVDERDAGPAQDAAAGAGLATASRQSQIRRLLAFLGNTRQRDLVRAHVPLAAARLAIGEDTLEAEVIAALLPIVNRHSGEGKELEQGVVQALGLLGDADDDWSDQKLREELFRLAESRDVLTRSMAWVALGRVAARPGKSTGTNDARTRIRSFLLARLARSTTAGRPWAALSLGLMERELSATRQPTSPDVAAALRARLAGTGNQDEAGAYAVALGLVGDVSATPAILARLSSKGQDTARGHAAVALGLLEAGEAVEPLREILRESKYRPELIRTTAIGLGLLSDKEVVPDLIELLESSKALSSQAAVASALGAIGDRRSVDALLELLQREDATGLARAFAAAALGIVGDKEPLPFNSKLAADVNYAAAPPTLVDPLTSGGVLDIL